MSDCTTLVDNPNALLFSVNREKSTDGPNWYFVRDWTQYHIDDPSTLPAAIRDEFDNLGKHRTVGAFATGWNENDIHSEIRLYLINISAVKKRPGKPGKTISGFPTALANQTILLRDTDNGGAHKYSVITQAVWSVPPYSPCSDEDHIRKDVDRLINHSELAVQVHVKPSFGDFEQPLGGSVITCYLLNLASFTDPPTR